VAFAQGMTCCRRATFEKANRERKNRANLPIGSSFDDIPLFLKERQCGELFLLRIEHLVESIL